MKKWVAAAAVGIASVLGTLQLNPPPLPYDPPAQQQAQRLKEVRVNAFYDEEFAKLHPKAKEYIEDILASHNKHWRELRPERFVLSTLRERHSANKSDGNYHLRKLIKDLRYKEDEVNVYFMGQEIFFYDLGYPEHYGGVAHNSDNIMIVFAGRLKKNDDEWTDARIKTAFTHEAGHLYGARDVPLGATNSTYAMGRSIVGMDEVFFDTGSKHIISTFTPSPSSRQEAYRLMVNLESAILKHFVNRDEVKPIVEDLIYHANLRNNEEYTWTAEELKAAGVECEKGAFEAWLRSYERKAGSPLNWNELRAVSEEYARADAAFKRREFSEALAHNLLAHTAYQGNDGRILQVLSAMDQAIAKAMRESTGASTSLRSR